MTKPVIVILKGEIYELSAARLAKESILTGRKIPVTARQLQAARRALKK